MENIGYLKISFRPFAIGKSICKYDIDFLKISPSSIIVWLRHGVIFFFVQSLILTTVRVCQPTLLNLS